MARRLVVLLALVVSCKRATPKPADPPPSPPPTSDLGKQAAAFLVDARRLEADALMKSHRTPNVVTKDLDRDIGFGARAWSRDFYDETTQCTKGAIVFEDKTVLARVLCRPRDSKKHDWSSTKADLARVGAVEDRHDTAEAIAIDWKQPEALARLRATIARALGPAPDVTVPNELRADYDDLEIPLADDYAFGVLCGDGGEPPAGAIAIKRISAAKRTDLLRALARAPSPEGRLYAARALGETALIEKLSTMSTPVIACFGCRYSRMPTSDLVAADFSLCPSCEPPSRGSKVP